MGNSSPPAQGDRVDHERLGAVTLEMIPRNPLEDEEDDSYLMHFTKTVESQKAYNEWAKGMETVQDSETEEVLLLPRKHEFQSVGLCGAGGLAKVRPPTRSSPTTTTSSCWRRRSPTAGT